MQLEVEKERSPVKLLIEYDVFVLILNLVFFSFFFLLFATSGTRHILFERPVSQLLVPECSCRSTVLTAYAAATWLPHIANSPVNSDG